MNDRRICLSSWVGRGREGSLILVIFFNKGAVLEKHSMKFLSTSFIILSILVTLWFIIIYFSKPPFSGLFSFKGNFVCGKKKTTQIP